MPNTSPVVTKFQVSNLTLAMRSWAAEGNSPAILLLHYFGGSSREWEFVAPLLAKRGHSCVALDARGHGDSDAAERYTVGDMAKDSLAAADISHFHSHPNGWILVGHSMGGKAALDLAASAPAGLRGLVLTAPSPPTPQPMSDEERQQEIDSYGNAEASEKSATKIAIMPLSDEARAIFVEDNLRTAESAWIAWNEIGTREDISEVMAQIHLPTLLITGGKDPVIPQEVYEREVAGRLPLRLEQMVIPEGGHLITMTNPELVAGKIAEWAISLPK